MTTWTFWIPDKINLCAGDGTSRLAQFSRKSLEGHQKLTRTSRCPISFLNGHCRSGLWPYPSLGATRSFSIVSPIPPGPFLLLLLLNLWHSFYLLVLYLWHCFYLHVLYLWLTTFHFPLFLLKTTLGWLEMSHIFLQNFWNLLNLFYTNPYNSNKSHVCLYNE